MKNRLFPLLLALLLTASACAKEPASPAETPDTAALSGSDVPEETPPDTPEETPDTQEEAPLDTPEEAEAQDEVSDESTVIRPLPAYGIELAELPDVWYSVISLAARKEYGLVPADAIGVTPETDIELTEADLGEPMGTVASCVDPSLIGCAVYHFARFPTLKSICVVDRPDGLALYTGNWVPDTTGLSFSEVLDLWGLPDTLASLQLQTPMAEPLAEITDEATIAALLDTLRRADTGSEAESGRRIAQLWYDAYGNDNLCYDEASGRLLYRFGATHEAAQALFAPGERMLRFTTADGFHIVVDYFPALRYFRSGDGVYLLDEAAAAQLDQLLQALP